MSVATRTSPSGGPTNRLPRSPSPANRGREIRLGILGVLGLVVLVVGIPVALVLFVGYPLPRTAPSREWLTHAISATLIINVLACVVWLIWAHFTVCLLAEWRAVRRGRLPSHVALGGGSQLLARRLVAAALLLAGAATMFPHSGGGPAARPPAAISVQHSAVGPAQAPAPAAQVAAPQQHRARSDAGVTAAASKYYVVEPPRGRRYDSLWDIADRTLHDPLRYKEIFALNKDRIQSDGSKLLDANLILPGWELRLPADASGPGVHVAHVAQPTRSTPTATPAADSDAGPVTTGLHGGVSASSATALAGTGGAASATVRSTGGDTVAPAAASSRAGDWSLTSIVFGGALMLAGVLAALSARRGPYAPQTQDEVALDLAADPGMARKLDRAMRNLAAARAQQGRPLPHPVVVWVSEDRITLNLAGGDVAEPPAPWLLGDDPRSWTCSVAEAAGQSEADVAAPFPGLLSVGRDQGHELFVDFEQAPGPISIGGNLELGRELATALAVQAATSLWSDGARVTVVGFGDGAELTQIDPKAVAQVRHLSEVLEEIEHQHEDVLRLQRDLGVDGVLTGRQARRSGSWQPHLIALSGPPTPDEAVRLRALGGARSNFVVLVVGDMPAARWRFVIDAAGRLDLGILGASAQAHRLNRTAVARLAELLSHATQDKQAQTRSVAAMTPHGAVASLGAAEPTTPRQGAIAASVSLLGPVAVQASGPLDPAKLDLLTEIVVAVALHPDGLHDAVLRASIWPRGAGDAVCAAAMLDAATWLGADAAGLACLTEAEGRWYLSDAVAVDWHELRRRADVPAGPDELDSLTGAVALFRGVGFSATPPGCYGWLAFARAARDSRVVATAVVRRAAAVLAEHRSLAEAEAVLRRGLELMPAAELIWRDLLVIASRRGPDNAGIVAEQMYATLRRGRVWPEPETDALVAQLAPSRTAERSA